MSGFQGVAPRFMDIETLRREQREERQARILADADRQCVSLARLRATNVLPANDPIFLGHSEPTATTVEATVTTTAEPDSAAARKGSVRRLAFRRIA
jgi:hypothetical protein